MKDLNKDCKLFNSVLSQPENNKNQDPLKITLDTCLSILNDKDKPMSLKYQFYYSYIFQEGREVDYRKLKNLFDKLEDNSFNAIIKVDMSYMMSVTKNKEFIP
jgi:hypothetical protein